MDIPNNEIDWTKGTDKPYGQVIYEHWKDKLGKNPTKEEIRGLRNEVLATKNSVKKLKKHYEDILSSPNCGDAGAINALGHLELYEDSHKRLSNLYDSYREPEDKTVNHASTDKPERETIGSDDINQLIETFAELFAEGTDYSEIAISTYIIEWQKRDGITTQRAKAKTASKKKCKELEQVKSDGTFTNWENKWTEFHASRTGK